MNQNVKDQKKFMLHKFFLFALIVIIFFFSVVIITIVVNYYFGVNLSRNFVSGPHWTGICNQHAPGDLNLIFKDTVSIDEAKIFINQIVIDKYKLATRSGENTFSSGNLMPDKVLEYKYYRPYDVQPPKNTNEKYKASDISNFVSKITRLNTKLSNDPDIEFIKGIEKPPISVNNSRTRIYEIKLKPHVNEVTFLGKYPEIVKVPKNLKIESTEYQKKQGNLPQGKFYGLYTLQPVLNLISNLPSDVIPQYSDAVNEFSFTFPSRFTRKQIKEILKPIWNNYADNHLSKISFRFTVPPKQENQWIKEFYLYTDKIEQVEKARPDCVE